MRVVVATDDRIGPRMAGSALRAWEIARAIAGAGHSVRLVAASGSTPIDGSGPPPELVVEPGWAQAMIAPPWSLTLDDFRADRLLIIDGATPLLAELAVLPNSARVRRRRRTAAARLPLAAARADAVLVAGSAQSRWWQARLRRPVPIIGLPFGVSEPPPADIGGIPGVPKDWRIALWWGGVWPWLDLETLIAARKILDDEKLSLVVPTAPRPGGGASSFSRSTLEEVMARHGLSAPQVVGLDTWVPYSERHRLLNRATVLAVLHHDGEEADLSFRTRALDGVWAGVPLLLSEGGEVSHLAQTHGWGEVVPVGDVATTAAALKRLLDDEHHARCRRALIESSSAWRWPELARPLIEWMEIGRQTSRSHWLPAAIRSALQLALPRTRRNR